MQLFSALPLQYLLSTFKFIMGIMCMSILNKEYACTCAYVLVQLELDSLGTLLSTVTAV